MLQSKFFAQRRNLAALEEGGTITKFGPTLNKQQFS